MKHAVNSANNPDNKVPDGLIAVCEKGTDNWEICVCKSMALSPGSERIVIGGSGNRVWWERASTIERDYLWRLATQGESITFEA